MLSLFALDLLAERYRRVRIELDPGQILPAPRIASRRRFAAICMLIRFSMTRAASAGPMSRFSSFSMTGPASAEASGADEVGELLRLGVVQHRFDEHRRVHLLEARQGSRQAGNAVFVEAVGRHAANGIEGAVDLLVVDLAPRKRRKRTASSRRRERFTTATRAPAI